MSLRCKLYYWFLFLLMVLVVNLGILPFAWAENSPYSIWDDTVFIQQIGNFYLYGETWSEPDTNRLWYADEAAIGATNFEEWVSYIRIGCELEAMIICSYNQYYTPWATGECTHCGCGSQGDYFYNYAYPGWYNLPLAVPPCSKLEE